MNDLVRLPATFMKDGRAMPKKRQKTPQEKKILSYQKDRRNDYGESPHGSRKNIPRRRARLHRAVRHAVRQALATKSEEDLDLSIANMSKLCVRGWRKYPDREVAFFIDPEYSHLDLGSSRRSKTGLRAEALRRIRKKKGLAYRRFWR